MFWKRKTDTNNNDVLALIEKHRIAREMVEILRINQSTMMRQLR